MSISSSVFFDVQHYRSSQAERILHGLYAAVPVT